MSLFFVSAARYSCRMAYTSLCDFFPPFMFFFLDFVCSLYQSSSYISSHLTAQDLCMFPKKNLRANWML